MPLFDNGIADHLADTADAHDASAISVLDTAGDYTATDVEGVLAEIATLMPGAGCRATYSGTWTHNSTGNWLSAPLDTEVYDTNAFHSTVTNNSRMTVPTGLGGTYLIVGGLNWSGASANGQRDLQILLNNTTSLAQVTYEPEAAIAVAQFVVAIAQLSATDYVELQAYQSSGGNVAMIAATPHLTIVRLSA